MHAGLNALIESLLLEPKSEGVFHGYAKLDGSDHVYGGHVVAQAISAGQQQVAPEYILHSIHAHFLKAGIPERTISYQVNMVREGRSYCTCLVEAYQQQQRLFIATLSFQKSETSIHHQAKMPDVPGPENFISDSERYRHLWPDGDYAWPIEFVQVEPMAFDAPQKMPSLSYTWFKAAEAVGENKLLHQQLLGYASDNPLLVTALKPHGLLHFSPGLMINSLDHALWFHQEYNINDWLLFVTDSDYSGQGRAISQGKIFDRQGRLVASAMQEGVLRYREPVDGND